MPTKDEEAANVLARLVQEEDSRNLKMRISHRDTDLSMLTIAESLRSISTSLRVIMILLVLISIFGIVIVIQ